MTASAFDADPRLVALARAIGLVDADGAIDGHWFSDPLTPLGTIVSNPVQRRALLDLTALALPPVSSGPPGEQWHPLVEDGPHGIYLTIAGDVLGLAARAGTTGPGPNAALSLRLPLVDASTGLNAVAGTARGPLELRVDVTAGSGALDASLLAQVDLEGGGRLRIVVRDADLGDGRPRTVELDPLDLGADAAPAVVALVREVLETAGLPDNRVVEHLPGVLGMVAGLPALPLDRLATDPAAFRSWIGQLAADLGTLRRWFLHLAGLVGAGMSAADPGVTGDGTEAFPFSAPLLSVTGGPTLVMTLARNGSGDNGRVLFGLGVDLEAGLLRLRAGATVAAVATGGTAPAVVLPDAGATLTAVPPVPTSGAVRVGAVLAGLRWSGQALEPRLELHDVDLGSGHHDLLDLSSGDAIAASASAALGDAISEALGPTGPGHALAALLGLVPPAADPTSPHRLVLTELATGPTRAIAAFHRSVLADGNRWSALLAEIGALVGLEDPVTGTGSENTPWRLRLAEAGPAEVDLVAWAPRAGAAGHRLRLGLMVAVDPPRAEVRVQAALLGFDLGDAPTVTGLVPEVMASVSTVPVPVRTSGGLHAAADRAAVEAVWQPGTAVRITARVDAFTLHADGETIGPVDVAVPGPGGFDPEALDLGSGLPPEVLAGLLRLLTAELASSWGGPTALVATALLGLHRRLPGLPGDWPVLLPGRRDDDLGGLLRDPVPALRQQLRALTTGVSADGRPFALPALQWLQAVLDGRLQTAAGLGPQLLDDAPRGWGTEMHPWRLSLPADDRVDLLLWTGEATPGAGWAGVLVAHLLAAVDGPDLIDRVATAAGPLPTAAAAVDGRDPDRLGDALDRLDAWLSGSDGVVPLVSQAAVGPGWEVGPALGAAHGDLPGDPAAIAQVAARLDGWASAADRCVLLIAAPFEDHRAWTGLLAVIDPDHAPDAHFHLRVPGVDPSAVDLDEVLAVSPTYTVDLADAGADPLTLLPQLERVVDRARALTGQPKVHLVAHSAAGVAARAFAAAHPDRVAGVVTLATPHAGSPLTPLQDTGLVDAVRATATLSPSGRSASLRAVAGLLAALDRTPTTPGAVTGAQLTPVMFGGLPQTFLDGPVPGLAVCAVAGPGLVGDLAADLARRIEAEAGDPGPPPPSLAVGLSVRPQLPDPGDDPVVQVHVRVPLAELPFDPTPPPGPAPVRRRRVQAEAVVGVDDGWLVGEARAAVDETEPRIRRARLGVTALSSGSGGRTVTAVADLHEAALGTGVTEPLVDLDAAIQRLGGTPVPLGRPAPASGTAAALLLTALDEAGLVNGGVLVPGALRNLGSAPAALLGPRALGLASRLLPALGLTGGPDGPWTVDLPQLGSRLTIGQGPWTATLAPLEDVEPLLSLDASLAVEAGLTDVELAARPGGALIGWRAGRLVAEVPGWIPEVTLIPPPSTPGLAPGVPAALGYLLGSAVVTALVNPLLPEGRSLRPLGTLLAAPIGFLTGRDVLAGPAGPVDPDRVNALLAAAGQLLGLPAGTGLELPGGLAVRAVPNPTRILLTGSLDLGADESLTIAVGITADGEPAGELSLTRALPGNWTSVTVTAGVDRSGLALSVTPGVGAAIRLLPSVDGVGALAGAAVRLLPQVLQELVVEVRKDGPPGPVFDLALALAEALGVYGDDADGFLRADRSAELGRMLEPGWLEGRLGSAPAIAGAIVDLLEAVHLPMVAVTPAGPTAVAAAIRLGTAGPTVTVTVGWTDGPAPSPTVMVELGAVDLGPAEIESVALGYDGELHALVRVGLRPPAPVPFLQPSLEIDLDGAAFAVSLLPFGPGSRADAAVILAPQPHVTFTDDGALALLERWGLPLLATIGLTAFADQVDDPLWAGGPSPVDVLTEAGLVRGGVLVAVPPPAGEMALRALAALAAGLSVPLAGVQVGLVNEDGQYGIRLRGRVEVEAGDLMVSMRFGDTDWLDEPSAGATFWLMADTGGAVPALRPALDLVGLGAVLTGRDGPLLDGALTIGGVGVFAFGRATFTDDQGAPAVAVDGLGAGGQLDQASLVISPGDSFVAQVIPSDIEASLDIAASWREEEGLRFYRATGAGGLEITVPLDIHAAILQITELWLRLQADGSAASLTAAVSGRGDLGPLHLVVKRVGIEARFGPGGSEVLFRPPDGAGLSLDAGVVSGGGYLAHDEALHQYAGAVQLQFAAISLKALGIVTTRQPDGSPGFSLLIIISAEFTPIQLGFGFVLIGVGGLLGLNRTTDVPVLRAGIREGTVGSILFPTDLVANAPRIISDLNRVFPQAQGRFLVGPMAKLGWGTPPIITVTLGVVIDLPSPVRLIVLGRVNMALPDADAAIVELNLDVLGVVDFDRGELSFDASLFDSRIAAFDVTGDMALRASWGANPMFALSAGGFHPRFQTPPGFPALNRLAISLATGDNPRIRLESYLALTSNTAQFGARLELYAEAAGFSLQGWLGFDALFQFSPFCFQVDVTGGVLLKSGQVVLFAVTVDLNLSGPRPWRARGLATFHVLFFDVSIGFDITIGRADPPPLPEPADVAALLEAALDDLRSWTAQLPAAADTVFSLRDIPTVPGQLLAHPLGSLAFTQRVVPLATTIERFGTARPQDDVRFDVAVTVGGRPADAADTVEQFAPAQFFALSDDDRLNQPSFRAMPAGQKLAATSAGRDHWLVRAAPLDYEEKVVDAPDRLRVTAMTGGAAGMFPSTTAGSRPRRMSVHELTARVATSPSSAAPTRRAGRGRFGGAGLALGVRRPGESG